MGAILIVNSMPIIRAGLRAVLESMRISAVLHEAGTADEAQAYLADSLQLIILDPEMPNIQLPQFVRHLRQRHSQVPLLFFGGQVETLFATQAVQLGADGYLSRASDQQTVVAAIQTLLGGMQCFPRSRYIESEPPKKERSLSQKEIEVLKLLRQGLRSKDVARRLYLSEKTISAHKHNILLKLGVTTLAHIGDHESLSPSLAQPSQSLPRQGILAL